MGTYFYVIEYTKTKQKSYLYYVFIVAKESLQIVFIVVKESFQMVFTVANYGLKQHKL